MDDLHSDLDFALKLAGIAATKSFERFQSHDLIVSEKPDTSPVTDADRAVERELRDLIAAERPEDSVFAEEFQDPDMAMATSGRQWIIDPIDGTANFLRGNPIWGNLVALAIDGVPVLGVASLPALKKVYWAAEGLGAWVSEEDAEPRQIRVSAVSRLADAALSFPRVNGWVEAGFGQQALDVSTSIWRTMGGSDLWSYCMVAEGVADGVVEFDLEPYDIAALIPIVREAGGMFTDLSGAPAISGRHYAVSNGGIHDELLAKLQ